MRAEGGETVGQPQPGIAGRHRDRECEPATGRVPHHDQRPGAVGQAPVELQGPGDEVGGHSSTLHPKAPVPMGIRGPVEGPERPMSVRSFGC